LYSFPFDRILTTYIGDLNGQAFGGQIQLEVGVLPGDVLHSDLIRIEHGLFERGHHQIAALILIEAVAQFLNEAILKTRILKS